MPQTGPLKCRSEEMFGGLLQRGLSEEILASEELSLRDVCEDNCCREFL